MEFDIASLVTLLSVILTFVLGYFGYKRSKAADKVAEKAGAVEQIVNGLNSLIDQLQEDNHVLRENVKDLRDALQKVTNERDNLKQELQDLKRQYSTNS